MIMKEINPFFENLVEKSIIKKIPKNNYSGIKTLKLENVIIGVDILPDTYVIHSSGGWHPFSAVNEAPSIYKQNIWPYVERIKWTENRFSKEDLDKIRSVSLRNGTTTSQINATIGSHGYPIIALFIKGRYLKNSYTQILKNGQHCKTLAQNRRSFLLHRLVALAFIPNLENKNQVMHINNNPSNYLIENLKWGTASENMKGKSKRSTDTMKDKYLSAVTKGYFKNELL